MLELQAIPMMVSIFSSQTAFKMEQENFFSRINMIQQVEKDKASGRKLWSLFHLFVQVEMNQLRQECIMYLQCADILTNEANTGV